MRGARFWKPLCSTAAVLLALGSVTGMLPPVRAGIVNYIAENYMHRELNAAYWTQQLFALSFIVFALDLFSCLAFVTRQGRSLCRELAQELKGHARALYADRKAVLILFCLYTFGMLTIFHANYYYGAADDLYRAMSGARAWRNFYRYISHFLSVFVHTSPKLFDIAPFTQLLALFVMAVSALLLIRIFMPGRGAGTVPAGTDCGAGTDTGSPRPLSLFVYLAAVPVCLFPYFLENLSYRYDAPYIALSVFFCIVPFLFTDRLRLFAPVSLVSLFLMCLSYQAASGVYIVVCAFCVFRMWSTKERPLRQLLLFVLTAVTAYALSLLIFFAIFNVQPTGESYVAKNFFIRAFPLNAKAYLAQIWDDFGWST
ncbi:MAG: glucosyltransferase domain-containing protein, partial [Treponema sp.]|nr:glucosyltransferase domain-containing protein [Treponema sp.]